MTTTASHSANPPHRRPVLGGHGGVPEDGLRPAPGPEGALPVGGGPWSVRSVRPGRGRAALELYQHGELADVLVAARLTPQLLRGARRSPSGSGRSFLALAWGRLPAGGRAPAVEFTGRRLLGRVRCVVGAEVATVGGEFWLAWAEGPVDAVWVRCGEAAERLPLERVRGPQGASAGGAA
ncbi:hypothetical protein [Kitasatospora sp. NPDC101183]|uniref:hypothetical protein n=1 Tax=Kitasatospora sp. NPDC101183 TaxID=3364100 RepID=UPI0037FCBDC5